jgi:AcrR family transcriptional regulator
MSTDQREKILNAALKQFAARGYKRATLDEIAAEVGLGTPALYYYFRNKMDLFKAVTEREGSRILDAMEAAVAKEADPVRQLRAFCLTRFRLVAEAYALLHISERVHREFVALNQRLKLAIFRREAAIVEGILERGVRAGTFAPVEVPRTAAFILQIFRCLRTEEDYFGERIGLEKRVDFAMDLLLRGLERRA